jgi:hypothetical protein
MLTHKLPQYKLELAIFKLHIFTGPVSRWMMGPASWAWLQWMRVTLALMMTALLTAATCYGCHTYR